MQVYLSGPMEYATDSGIPWRQKAVEFFRYHDVEAFDPTRSKVLEDFGLNMDSYKKLKTGIDHNKNDFLRYLKATRAFIDLDVIELQRSNVVLANLDLVYSPGTAGEVTLANYLSIPIIGFTNNKLSEIAGWLVGSCNKVFTLTDSDDPLSDAMYDIITRIS